MLDISVIILTYNEELHIRRCLENICPIANKVIVVDSPSTDSTVAICHEFDNVEVVAHKYPGNQAEQFNWAIDNLGIETEWVLRLDADEYLTPELINELKEKLPTLPNDVNGIIFNRRHIFMGKWVKRGVYPVKLLRMFRYGKGVCEQRLMDEHIQLTEGRFVEFNYDFCDHNLNNLSWWTQKHIGYAIREATDLLDMEYDLTGSAKNDETINLSSQALKKRRRKHGYAKKPLFWRSFAYFIYRYFFKLGFLEGKEGFLWHFLQGWWYRTLVDAKVYEIKRKSEGNPDRIKAILRDEYNIVI